MIGAVSASIANASKCAGRGIPASASELEIFYNLDGNHVHYEDYSGRMYFVASEHSAVKSLIRAAFAGMRQVPLIDQLHLDPHGYFRGARRIQLTSAQATTVMVALRLGGIQISRSSD